VVTSDVSGFAKGDIVVGRTGWQSHALSDGSGLQKVDPTRAPISTALGVLGMPGMTAYMGLLEIGRPAAGETVVVAAASGAVGAVVGQIARIKGARAVGIAGGPDKCRYVTEGLGFDDCIDHRAPDLATRLAAACPKGIDVYFENVGGAVFEAVFPMLNPFARIPVCGLISMYNATTLSPGPILLPHMMRAILTKRLTFRGFIVSDFSGSRSRRGQTARSAWSMSRDTLGNNGALLPRDIRRFIAIFPYDACCAYGGMFGFRDFNPGGVLHTFPYLLDVFSTVHESRDRPAELPAAEEELWRT